MTTMHKRERTSCTGNKRSSDQSSVLEGSQRKKSRSVTIRNLNMFDEFNTELKDWSESRSVSSSPTVNPVITMKSESNEMDSTEVSPLRNPVGPFRCHDVRDRSSLELSVYETKDNALIESKENNKYQQQQQYPVITPPSSVVFASSSTLADQDDTEYDMPPYIDFPKRISLFGLDLTPSTTTATEDDEEEESCDESTFVNSDNPKTVHDMYGQHNAKSSSYHPNNHEAVMAKYKMAVLPPLPVTSYHQSIKQYYGIPKFSTMVTLLLQMLLVQLVVWFSMNVYYQATHKLSLPTPEIGYKSFPSLSLNASTLTLPTQSASNFNDDNDGDGIAAVTTQTDDDCIYVPGGGFSGFWFSLGRLQSLTSTQIHQETFVCYSAGCLGVVATLLQHLQKDLVELDNVHPKNNNTIIKTTSSTSPTSSSSTLSSSASTFFEEELYNMARNIQLEWLQGDLHRYQVVEAFIDRMMDTLLLTVPQLKQRIVKEEVDDPVQQQQQQRLNWVYDRFWTTIQQNLYILTSSVPIKTTTTTTMIKKPWWTLSSFSTDNVPRLWWLEANMHRAQNLNDLKRLLLQTTWIPMAVGSSLSYHGQLDGAFTTMQHPSCRRNVGLVVPRQRHRLLQQSSQRDGYWWDGLTELKQLLLDSWKLWSNTLNVNLAKQDVEDLWQMGLEYGV